MASLKIASLNVRGLRNAEKRRDIFDWLRNKNFSVCFLQETHSSEDVTNIWLAEWGYKILFSHGTTQSCGTCILINNNFNYVLENCIADDHGRYIIATLKIDEEYFILCNIYGPIKQG
jgi:exonuclease III